MPSETDFKRYARRARQLELAVIRFSRVRKLATVESIATRFGIADLHAYTILEAERVRQSLQHKLKARLGRLPEPPIKPAQAAPVPPETKPPERVDPAESALSHPLMAYLPHHPVS
jgi:hypothetical protein